MRPTRLGQPFPVVLEGGCDARIGTAMGSDLVDQNVQVPRVPPPGLRGQRSLDEVVDVGSGPGGRRVEQDVAPRVEHRGDLRGRPVLGLQQCQGGQDLAVVGVQGVADRDPTQARQDLGGLVDEDALDMLTKLVHRRSIHGPATG